jgi:heme/copper-type cytochrome/quinol oxidase subunit 3
VSLRRETTPASVPAERRGEAIDVRGLPSYGFGNRSLMWWGTAGMIVIEGSAFAFMIVVYFYLRSRAAAWPAGTEPPGLFWGSLNLLLILLSAIPNTRIEEAAIDKDLPKVRRGLAWLSGIGFLLLAVRALEFTTLNVRADEGAYGASVWMLLGLHTFNLVTDIGDSLVLTALMYKGPFEGKRFVDVAENAGYWDFVVVSWIPIYVVIYWGARF